VTKCLIQLNYRVSLTNTVVVSDRHRPSARVDREGQVGKGAVFFSRLQESRVTARPLTCGKGLDG